MLPLSNDTDAPPIDAVRAFSAQASHFDSDDESSAILQWMRAQVHRHEEEFLAPGDSILELNSGTGIDAVRFARMGCTVLATDAAEGMIEQLREKIRRLKFEERISALRCGFTELAELPDRKFDHVFSNFGGLNCIPDLRRVTKDLPRLLKPGATVTFVFMPPVCPWEIVQVLRGKFGFAFRRFSKHGTEAQVDGVRFRAYYFSPRKAVHSFDGRFIPVRLRGLASVTPPPGSRNFPDRHPRLYRMLTRLEERCAGMYPFNRYADHIILTMKYLPQRVSEER